MTKKATAVVLLAMPLAFSCQQPMNATEGDGGQRQEKQIQAQKNEQKKAKVVITGEWDPKVAEQLALIIEKNRPKPGAPAPVAVFDFDNTIVRGDMGRAFFDYMIRKGLFKFTEEVWNAFPEQFRADLRKAWERLEKLPAEKRAGSVELSRFRQLMHRAYWNLCKEPDPGKCFPWQVRFYAGYTPEQIEKIGREVFEQELKKPLATEIIRAGPDDSSPVVTASGMRIVRPMKDLIETLEKNGFEVWIVTAGPQWVVAGAAPAVGVPSNRVLGMRAKLKEGRLTAEIDPPPTFRQGKVEAIRKFIGRKPVLAVGDSWTDAEMLDYAQHALLVDRGYADLKRRAAESGWLVQPAFTGAGK